MQNPIKKLLNENHQPVYLVDGARTPFLKAKDRPGPFSPVDLAVQCGRPLLSRLDLPADAIDRVILGCVNVLPAEMNPARVAALRLGLSESIPAHTVQINCGSGMLSIDDAYRQLRQGDGEIMLAGGCEAMSHVPLSLQPQAVEWLADMRNAQGPQEYVRKLSDFHIADFKPEPSLKAGLTDNIAGMNMGQTAELVSYLFNISREAADEYALQSHQRLLKAQQNGCFDDEIVAMISEQGEIFRHDEGVRPDTDIDALNDLEPVFEPPYGKVTAGNSSQVTDGASWVVLATESALEKYSLTPLARIVDSQWAAIDPAIMGLAPALSSTHLLNRLGMTADDVGLWEINEAFAAQVLACLAAFDDSDFISMTSHATESVGAPDLEHLNIDGGAISMGHPIGTSGNRIVLHLAKALQRQDEKMQW